MSHGIARGVSLDHGVLSRPTGLIEQGGKEVWNGTPAVQLRDLPEEENIQV